jgi:tRNA (cmo5U34)-methyltransferase
MVSRPSFCVGAIRDIDSIQFYIYRSYDRGSIAVAMDKLIPADVNLWRSPDHALEYLERVDTIPHRSEGESALLDSLPRRLNRVLDLGSGDGRILAFIKQGHPHVCAVAVDFSDAMLERLRARFTDDGTVSVVAHDLDAELPDFGCSFDAIVSGFAIHHLAHPRKRSLYAEVFRLLAPAGVFCNLEHVASATEPLHHQFLERLGVTAETDDPSNKLLDVETQLSWLREIGFMDVDCHWKWRELALLAGTKP